jgi:hypothetical protein
MDNNFETVAPIAFLYERDTERSRMISRELRKFYLKDQPLTNASLSGLGEVSSAIELLKHTEAHYDCLKSDYICLDVWQRFCSELNMVIRNIILSVYS